MTLRSEEGILLLPPLNLRPRIPERHRSVEDKLFSGGIVIHTKVSEPLKLEAVTGLRHGKAPLDFAV